MLVYLTDNARVILLSLLAQDIADANRKVALFRYLLKVYKAISYKYFKKGIRKYINKLHKYQLGC